MQIEPKAGLKVLDVRQRFGEVLPGVEEQNRGLASKAGHQMDHHHALRAKARQQGKAAKALIFEDRAEVQILGSPGLQIGVGQGLHQLILCALGPGGKVAFGNHETALKDDRLINLDQKIFPASTPITASHRNCVLEKIVQWNFFSL